MFKLKCVRTEYTVNPIGVETQAPRFSWEYEAGENIIQKSYKILVASSPDLLFEGLADKWDSGIVFSRDCINIAYAGKELKSCELCYLKVFANTTNGVFESDIYTFEMGLFDKDWKISWRTCPLTASGRCNRIPPQFPYSARACGKNGNEGARICLRARISRILHKRPKDRNGGFQSRAFRLQ